MKTKTKYRLGEIGCYDNTVSFNVLMDKLERIKNKDIDSYDEVNLVIEDSLCDDEIIGKDIVIYGIKIKSHETNDDEYVWGYGW